nr:hypothetical protein CFP56_32763 [Quercus suber]
MPREFVLSMQPDEGPDFWKVKHVSQEEVNQSALNILEKSQASNTNISRIFKCQIIQNIVFLSINQNSSG